MSSPSGLWMPPVESETATTVEPSSVISRAAIEPALPKPWTATRVLVRSMPRWRGRLDDRVDAAAGRRLVAALRAAEADRLAGDDAGDRVAGVHRVGVHHPGHDLGVGVDVRRRDVLLGSDEDLDLGEEAAGQALELLLAELLGVDDDAALAAAVRDADDRALPGHPHGEGLDLVERDVLVVADAALGRPATEVVLDAVAGEDLDGSVVHVDREMDGQLAAGLAQDAAHALVHPQAVGGEIELSLRDFPGGDPRSDVLGGHGMEFLTCRAVDRPPSLRVVSRTTPRGAPPGPVGPDPVAARGSICWPEYSRRSAIRASSMVPVGKVIATLPQRTAPAAPARPGSAPVRLRSGTGSPRRRSPGRGAARPTRRRC